ncbi:type II secretion system F family protein [Duganella sp. FT92W]|uniref:Type II secretion system F family protein n=2 Tax=Pseudoduganella rivuli TaxID=2666085 RepID=A0A7X2IMV3_9BURK|nr:type II secretion system F family protein [Pseudoduganella rivuli]
MPHYLYQAMDAAGELVPGNMEAANVPDLELRLDRMGLDLVDYTVTRTRKLALGRRKVTRADIINFCFHMEQMTGAGVPILDGLGDLRDSMEQHPRFREIITSLIESIEAGRQLSEALQAHPEVFDRTFTSLVHAGEQSGRITDVFRNLADSLKWQDELAARTRKILTYPLVVAVVVLAVTFFLMIYLVPQLTAFIRNMGNTLPAHTRALIFVSGIFIHWWHVILAAPVVAWLALRWRLRRSGAARRRWDGFLLRVWLLGPVLHKIILARFATYFALMYAAGIPVLECLRLSEGIAGNRAIAEGFRRAAQLIAEGASVASAFQNTGIFPPLVVRMLKVGETTGALDRALRNVSYFYDREVKELTDRAQAMMEPAMTVILGLLLGWIMLSVLGPVYDTIGNIRL